MLTVDKYARIRQAHRDGMSIREIARTFHHSRRKVREVLASPEPKPFARPEQSTAAKLGSFYPIIQQILSDDEQALFGDNYLSALATIRNPHKIAGKPSAVGG